MEIRYYAYPVPAEFAQMAAMSPRDFISDDPLMDAWGTAEGRPRMLYLDKCWRNLQRLFAPSPGGPQPAYELVRGDVTPTDGGWTSFVRYLANDDMRRIADDLADAAVSECFVMDGVAQMRRGDSSPHDFESDVEYVLKYLRDAAKFTATVARGGEGVVYTIG